MCKIAESIICVSLILCSVRDLRKRTIPVCWLVAMSVIIPLVSIVCNGLNLWTRFFGALMGVLLLLVGRFTEEAIGYGDSWIILLIGIHVGIVRVIQVLFMGSVLASMVSVFFLWKRHWKRNSSLPFIPFLTTAYMGAMLI